MRNQKQTLLRRMFHISQTGTVAEYVQSFSELVDQINAFDAQPDVLHYLTRFLDGLVPAVRVLVAIQQPEDMDTAYTLALLYEELGDGCNPFEATTSTTRSNVRRAPFLPSPSPPPPPPSKWVSKLVEEKKQHESTKSATDERWSNLKAYRRAKGLCFTCGEKWGKDHVCKNTVQLHVIQEMLNCLPTDSEETEEDNVSVASLNLMISAAATSTAAASSAKTMQITVTVQGQQLLFLIDSGSSSCFIDQSKVARLDGRQLLQKPTQVQVAGCEILQATEFFPALQWSAEDTDFIDSFRILPLKSYDGIIGYDWLEKHSPMITHWTQQWIAFERDSKMVVLHGDTATDNVHALIELHLVQDTSTHKQHEISPGIQALLDEFATVFETPSGLPPRRQYDHHIPLIPGRDLYL